MTQEEPEWLDATEDQWEKKAELAMQNGNLGKALMFSDYANCREMFDEKDMSIEEIQARFG